MVKPIRITNDVGDTFIIPAALIPLCPQCLDSMRHDYHFFTSQRVARVAFVCLHKLSTRHKTRIFQFNHKGGVSQWR